MRRIHPSLMQVMQDTRVSYLHRLLKRFEPHGHTAQSA